MSKLKIAGCAAVLSIFLIFLVSWLALGPTFLPALLHQDMFVLAKTQGTSMLPTIKGGVKIGSIVMEGDYVVLDTTPEDLKVGDIIAYTHDNMIIGHRIIKIIDDGYICKGDNNPWPDPWIVKKNKVMGEVEWVISNPLMKKVAELWYESV